MLRNWLKKFLILQCFIFINYIILIFFNNTINSSSIFNFILAINAFIILLTIIYKPKFLSYHKFSSNRLISFDRGTSSTLTDSNFFIPFFNYQYFLQKDASLDRFCKENNIVDKEEFQDELIITYKMSFNNLVNKHRVQYFLDIAKTNKFNNYSIDALAQESGFSSRHHLYKPFKKFHGGTPSDFLYFANDSISG
jgi:AraC-like DNA-binding protein